MTTKRRNPGHLADYSRHARITPAAASKLLKKVGINYKQRFDFAVADKLIKESYKPQNAGKIRRYFPGDPPPTIDTPPTEEKPKFAPIVTQPGTYLDAQRRKELASAALKELEVRKRSGELIEVDLVERTLFNRARQTRDALLSLADRLAGILAPVTDQSKVHELLTNEIHQALESLAEKFSPDTSLPTETTTDESLDEE